jgi:DNA-binding MarR family transcriptional regulator
MTETYGGTEAFADVEADDGRAMLNEAASTARAATVARIVEDYEGLMHRLVVTHQPEFMEVPVTMAQAKVIYTVLAVGSLRMSELASRLGVSISTTSGQVDRLVDLGLLDRRDDPADRRQVVITATEAATALLERFRELNDRELRHLLDRVDDAGLALIERAIRVLAAAALPALDPPAAASAEGKDVPA